MRTIHKFTVPIRVERAGQIPLARYSIPGWPYYGAPIVRHVEIPAPGSLTAWIERNIPMVDGEKSTAGPSTVTWTLDVALYPTGAVIPLGEYLSTLAMPDPSGRTLYWHAHTFGSPRQTLNGHTEQE